MNNSLVHVAVAVLRDAQGRVLLARRPDHAHQGGLWEFPGGKLEPGEGIVAALRREANEELGVEVLAERPLIQVIHHYHDKSVLLDVHCVTAFRGHPHGREGQPLAWVAPESLQDYPMPAADRPIVAALGLPERYLITGPDPLQPDRFLQRLEGSLAGGQVRLVQFRVTGLEASAQASLAAAALAVCRRFGARLLVNGDPALAQRLGADGVHLSSARLAALEARPGPAGWRVGASCHGAAELERAAALGLDFALLSPVLPTRSHPEASPLGWPRFAELVREARLPVYALGGMTEADLPIAWQHGAQGIAAIGGLWRQDPD
jgi:8-oxo-dGTP diphosphatase